MGIKAENFEENYQQLKKTLETTSLEALKNAPKRSESVNKQLTRELYGAAWQKLGEEATQAADWDAVTYEITQAEPIILVDGEQISADDLRPKLQPIPVPRRGFRDYQAIAQELYERAMAKPERSEPVTTPLGEVRLDMDDGHMFAVKDLTGNEKRVYVKLIKSIKRHPQYRKYGRLETDDMTIDFDPSQFASVFAVNRYDKETDFENFVAAVEKLSASE